MAAQRKEDRDRVEKEEGEMLRAGLRGLPGGGTVFSSDGVRVTRKGKLRQRGTGKSASPQVAAGSRVQKKQKESEGDFYRLSKRLARGVKKEGEGKADRMDLNSEGKGGRELVGRAKEAFGEGEGNAAKPLTKNHSREEPISLGSPRKRGFKKLRRPSTIRWKG